MPAGSATAASTPLARRLLQRIQQHGPISYAEWMAAALYAPRHGYYRRGRPTVGPDGDFLTSPELHPLFGAAAAQLLSAAADALGNPQPFRVVEVGPGTGALAESLLLALDTPIELILVEPDEAAAEAQRRRLERFGAAIEWRSRVGAIDGSVHAVIANELLDAQPVHRLRFADGRWCELLVGAGPDAAFRDHPAPISDPALLEPLSGLSPAADQIVEVSPARADLAAALANLIGSGLLLLFDYGYPRRALYDPRRRRGTLMTFRRHAPGENPYAYPGEQDISCHIDIDQVRAAAASAGLTAWRPQSQAAWLQALSADLLSPPDDAPARIAASRALEALCDPEGLGRIAVMAATRGPIEALPGLGSRPQS